MKNVFIILVASMAAIAAYGRGGHYVLIAKDAEFVNGRYAYLGIGYAHGEFRDSRFGIDS